MVDAAASSRSDFLSCNFSANEKRVSAYDQRAKQRNKPRADKADNRSERDRGIGVDRCSSARSDSSSSSIRQHIDTRESESRANVLACSCSLMSECVNGMRLAETHGGEQSPRSVCVGAVLCDRAHLKYLIHTRAPLIRMPLALFCLELALQLDAIAKILSASCVHAHVHSETCVYMQL